MSSLFNEAVADAKKLRELALTNAEKAVLENLRPKLEKMIEQRLMQEADDSFDAVDKKDDDEDDVLLDLADSASDDPGASDVLIGSSEPAGITLPDEEGKVTIDLDDFVVPDDGQVSDEDLVDKPDVEESDDVMLNVEAVGFLKKLMDASRGTELAPADDVSRVVTEAVAAIKSQNHDRIVRILRDVEHTYFCVRESKTIDRKEKQSLVAKLGVTQKRLMEAAKRKVAKNKVCSKVVSEEVDMSINKFNEADMEEIDELDETDELDEGSLEITLSGLPEEVLDDAEGLSVDVEPSEDELEGEEGMDMGDEGGEDLDMDMGDEGGEEDELELSDDDVVEVSESMLRRELARVARSRRRRMGEASMPPAGGTKPGPDEFDDFGDAVEDEEALDKDESDLNKLAERRRRVREARRHRMRAKAQTMRESVELRRVRRSLVETRKALAAANLFNAKMVYANKLLQRQNLTERQKVRIVESLDTAHSVREVKLLYKSLVDSLSLAKTVNESVRSKRVLGSSSRPASSSGTSKPKEQLNEANEQISRWGLLAGMDAGEK